MEVVLTPLGGTRGREPIVVHSLPVTVSRPHREHLCPAAWTVSESHCEIDQEDGLLVVRDYGSRHGTFVNQVRVTRCCLWPGDVLTIGVNSYRVDFDLAGHHERIQGLAQRRLRAVSRVGHRGGERSSALRGWAATSVN